MLAETEVRFMTCQKCGKEKSCTFNEHPVDGGGNVNLWSCYTCKGKIVYPLEA